MSLRTTFVLIAIGIAVAIVAYINPFQSAPEVKEDAPWFYTVSEDDILQISVRHRDQQISFGRDDEGFWEFEGLTGVGPTHRRWGGMVLILTGPQTRRLLQTEIKAPAQYGLDNPETTVNVTLKNGRTIEVSLGDKTTDGTNHYGQVAGYDDLFLITSGWGNVLTRLVTEPPFPEWFVSRNYNDMVELSIIRSTHHGGNDSWLQFKLRNSEWQVQRFSLDTKPTPVDVARWTEEGLPLLNGPNELLVHDPHVNDFTPYGIFEKSSGIHLRFEGVSQRGTAYEDGIVYRIGSKTPDGNYYYARTEEGNIEQPVLLLDAAWVDAVFALDVDVPYGGVPTRVTPTPNPS
ncbi:MAG: hypothetical protein O2854_04660 [Chloroflexi bacterium]|nr:hypothetical protein [Chloroflexota bacterium]